MLQSISHIALVVNDPARTAALFQDLFGVRAVEREDDEGHGGEGRRFAERADGGFQIVAHARFGS